MDAQEEAATHKAVGRVASGRAMVFRKSRAKEIGGLRISPMGVVQEKGNMRIIHDLTFRGIQNSGGGEQARPVNATTDWRRFKSFSWRK